MHNYLLKKKGRRFPLAHQDTVDHVSGRVQYNGQWHQALGSLA
jgi:hypothetical protein